MLPIFFYYSIFFIISTPLLHASKPPVSEATQQEPTKSSLPLFDEDPLAKDLDPFAGSTLSTHGATTSSQATQAQTAITAKDVHFLDPLEDDRLLVSINAHNGGLSSSSINPPPATKERQRYLSLTSDEERFVPERINAFIHRDKQDAPKAKSS